MHRNRYPGARLTLLAGAFLSAVVAAWPVGAESPTALVALLNEALRQNPELASARSRTDAAEAVYDILTVLGMVVHEDRTRQVNLIGFGKMGPLCLIARAMVPEEAAREKNVACIADMNKFDEGADEAYLKQVDIPGIERIGGLRAISAAAATGPMCLFNTGGKFDGTWAQKAGEVHKASVRVEREVVGFEEISTAMNTLSER